MNIEILSIKAMATGAFIAEAKFISDMLTAGGDTGPIPAAPFQVSIRPVFPVDLLNREVYDLVADAVIIRARELAGDESITAAQIEIRIPR